MGGDVTQKGKPPLAFLSGPDKVLLARILFSPNNIELLDGLIREHIRVRLFARPLLPHERPLVKQIASTLRFAIIDTLKEQSGRDSKYDGRKLLRYHWKRAGPVINRALYHLNWVCLKDFIDYPVDSLEKTVKRILPKLRRLPKYGRSKSRLLDVFLLGQYRQEYESLKEQVEVKAWKMDGTQEERMGTLKSLYPWAPGKKLCTWASKPPWQIAWEVVSLRYGPDPPTGAGVPPSPGRPRRSAAYLRRIQRQAAGLAKRIDEALEKNLKASLSRQ